MARKSRVNLPVETAVQAPEKIVLRTAVYARLSKETEANVERGTMDNQIDLICDYISRQNDLELYDIYADDCSGTTFDRPEFERMLSDMRKGNIDAVVVKDLSRLGRDHIETGNYIDNVFPMFNIRFISINDCYDSDKNSDGFMAAVTNIANSMYAKDISKKVCSVFQRNMEKGIPISNVPYGYKVILNENNVKEMVVDKEAAETVKRVFGMYLSGVGKQEICNILNSENVLTPKRYRIKNDKEKLEETAHLKWYIGILAQILKNTVYTGKYISGKRETALYKGIISYRTKDRTEWHVFEDHHEAIISKEDFEKAQSMAKPDYKRNKPRENIFRQKAFCGHCGRRMSISGIYEGKRYFRCVEIERYGMKACENTTLDEPILEKVVFEQIKIMMKLLLDIDEVTAKIKASDEYAEKKRKIQKIYTEKLNRLKELEKHKNDMYLHLCEGLIDENEYLALNHSFSEKIRSAEEELAEIDKSSEVLAKSPLDNTSVKQAVIVFKNKRKLSRDMIEAFIDKILVYSGNRIEIIFNFDDEIKEIIKRRTEGML